MPAEHPQPARLECLGLPFALNGIDRITAFDAATGALQWTAHTSPGATSQESSPSVFLNAVYVGSDNGLYAFNLLTGAPLWPRYPLGGTPGFYWGCNNTKDIDVRLETIVG